MAMATKKNAPTVAAALPDRIRAGALEDI